MKVNYQKEMEKIIQKIDCTDKPSLLLHSCCAPCSSYVLEYLQNYFKITVLFYNPNMIDLEEFEKRYQEQVKINKSISCEIDLIKVDYTSDEFFEKIKGLENHREGGLRCDACFELRLEEAASYAKKYGFDYFTTTLSISPLKNSAHLNSIGQKLALQYDTKYLFSDFKKKNGYKRSVELSKENELYRQDYCGCIYSKIERDNQI